ncbi:MAG: glycosyltransferase [Saprospiraceae bacterium]|nr:glycosyltransferase [Saprospiraceae bacterium]
MRILIITAAYAPFIHPRAHRWTSIAEQWAAQGNEVQVVTTRRRDCADAELINDVMVHRTGFDSLASRLAHTFGRSPLRGGVGEAVSKPGRMMRWFTALYQSVWKRLALPDDAAFWIQPALRKSLYLLENQHFDAVITVSLPFSGHVVGLRLKRHFSKKNQPVHWRWLADIGDPYSFQADAPGNSNFRKKWKWKLEKHVLQNADVAVVTTAALTKEYARVFGHNVTEKIRVIPPLYRPEPEVKSPFPSGNHALRLAWFGALYAPVRTPDAFLSVLAQLTPWKGRLEVHFFGAVFPEFYERLTQAGIQLHGLRSRAEVQAAMHDADVLLNIGNATSFQLPSKVVDYLATGRPVLNISMTEHDAFADFFRRYATDRQAFFDLHIKDGKVDESAIERLSEWLAASHPSPDAAVLAERLRPFQVSSVAAAYLGCCDIL